jgi:uncharacterized membrane protein YcaP (DUF421 family)
MFFDTWTGLVRVVVVGSLAYGALIFFLRISGKRTLTKLNAFDLVVTVALGSTLATILLSESVALTEGLVALALLIFLQLAISWLSTRSERFQSLIKAQPALVMHRGKFLDGPMRAERLTREEILAVLRESGVSDPSLVAAVVLETDGSLSVLRDAGAAAETLSTVRKHADG